MKSSTWRKTEKDWQNKLLLNEVVLVLFPSGFLYDQETHASHFFNGSLRLPFVQIVLVSRKRNLPKGKEEDSSPSFGFVFLKSSLSSLSLSSTCISAIETTTGKKAAEDRYYTDDAPGLRVTPNTVLITSLSYVGIVVVLHIFSKMLSPA